MEKKEIKKETKNEDKPSFEDNLKALEKIATELEQGELSLDESVKKFEEGMKISKECYTYLDKTEKKITELVNNNGSLEEVEYKRYDEE